MTEEGHAFNVFDLAEKPYPNTSADYGESYMVEISYADGNTTLHGKFLTEEEAARWAEARIESDYEDSYSFKVLVVNNVQ